MLIYLSFLTHILRNTFMHVTLHESPALHFAQNISAMAKTHRKVNALKYINIYIHKHE